jgi:hypothetical protein
VVGRFQSTGSSFESHTTIRMDDSDDEWLADLLGFSSGASAPPSGVAVAGSALPGTVAAGSAPPSGAAAAGSAPLVPLLSRLVAPHCGAAPSAKGDPPSVVTIRSERLQREAAAERQAELEQQARWDRHLGRLARSSPETRRSGRRVSESLLRCGSRSRSPHTCRDRAHQETSGVSRVNWDYCCDDVDPPMPTIVAQAKAAIQASSDARLRSGRPDFYVGVSRYLHRRWFGGDDLPPEDAHSRKWEQMYLVSTHSGNVGEAEDALITALKGHYGNKFCTNVRGGGGGVSPYKASLLYVCVGRLRCVKPHLGTA